MQSRWQKLWSRFRGSSATELVDAEQVSEPLELGTDIPEYEVWLDALIAAAADGLRLDEIGEDRFWQQINGLWSRGDELLAGQWIEKFVALPKLQHQVVIDMRLRLVTMFDERGNLQPVLEHLRALTQEPAHACDAHYHLGEHYRHRGDEVLALREFEAVLARDVDYPNVRGRVERLKSARGNRMGATMGETIVGAGGAGGDGNRYLLTREIGRGASGAVYLARDVQLEREVAVKLLHPHLAASDQRQALERFFDEARVAASLRHPNIVAILDLDEKSRRIVMEMCGGGTLRMVLKDRGPRPLRRALARHAQILSALDSAHARGIVHRDLKPANLMFRRDPDSPGAEVVLGDFGIAHLADAKSEAGASPSVERAVGTMAYMAPEQRQGLVTSQSDLYAAAVVLFEMLTGRYPWSREQLLAGMRRRGDFKLPQALLASQPRVGALLQAHLDGLGDPLADNRPDTTVAMKEARRLRDAAMLSCRDGDPILS